MLPKIPHPTPAGLSQNLHCATLTVYVGGSPGRWWAAIGKKLAAGGARYVRAGAAFVIFFVALGCWMLAEARECRMARALGLNYEGGAEDFE